MAQKKRIQEEQARLMLMSLGRVAKEYEYIIKEHTEEIIREWKREEHVELSNREKASLLSAEIIKELDSIDTVFSQSIKEKIQLLCIYFEDINNIVC